MKTLRLAPLFLPALLIADAAPLAFRRETIDEQIRIGYGLAIADVDGDGKPDILLADAKQIVWYRAPLWEKFVMAENLTPQDNVCVAAADLDGDGRAEVAVGAGWNPSDTVNSGAIFLLEPAADRTQPWKPVPLPHEPTTHRMAWTRDGEGKPLLAVLPLHGRGNQNGEGVGVEFSGYPWPWTETSEAVALFTPEAGLHATHNFDVVGRGEQTQFTYVASREGVRRLTRGSEALPTEITDQAAGEVREGQAGERRFLATVEPMHGHRLAVYMMEGDGPSVSRQVLSENLVQGHALATGDVLGTGEDQIVVGWRGSGRPGDDAGITLYARDAADGDRWVLHTRLDDSRMACEDLQLADLNGDGRLDIVASGRATKNVVIYWNERPATGREQME